MMGRGALGRELAAGEVLCRQGEIGDRMFVLQAGRAEVVHEEGGHEVVVGELGKGDIFGEMAIFDRGPRSATVRVKEKARVLTLDKRNFLRRVNEDPYFAYQLLASMSQRIRRLDDELSLLRNLMQHVRFVKYVLVVDADRPHLFEELRRDFAEDREVEVVLDRRRAGSSGERPPGAPERREPAGTGSDGWTLSFAHGHLASKPSLCPDHLRAEGPRRPEAGR